VGDKEEEAEAGWVPLADTRQNPRCEAPGEGLITGYGKAVWGRGQRLSLSPLQHPVASPNPGQKQMCTVAINLKQRLRICKGLSKD
jgi:hypothetical protein